ncbi:MAG: hypothetical protein GQ535_06755 [Rhodobacteraceae bacterium]|nr:hypothetical protein [Paracoccaceae bacterium]
MKDGIDAYCSTLHSSRASNSEKWYFLDELRESPNFQPKYEAILSQAKEVDRKWSFRRSMSQPAIVNLSYGIIAATLAELTEGLIYSGDGAWDFQTLPATGRAFLDSYFQPECSVKHEMQEWAAQNRMSLIAGVYK